MDKKFSDSYQGWSINVDCSENPGHFCSFDVTDPSGKSHHVPLGGDNPDRTLERAKEMIDIEVAREKG